ncbi:MAG: 50S ribosomal protein L23 [Phycisphaerales bacterium]|nr:50S ribosomal protein L23 [Phycisphaerales bacterium]
MDVYHAIIRPVVTEKSTHQTQVSSSDHGPAYTFEVHPGASKFQIRDAVEKIYGVNVVAVRTLVRGGKTRRFRFRESRQSDTKRAVVVLAKDQHLDLF